MQIESRTNPANKVIHVAMEAAHRREKCASVDCNDPLCAVVGFPLGATTTASRVSEAENVLEAGATEIDMVLPLGLLRTGLHGDVQNDME